MAQKKKKTTFIIIIIIGGGGGVVLKYDTYNTQVRQFLKIIQQYYVINTTMGKERYLIRQENTIYKVSIK